MAVVLSTAGFALAAGCDQAETDDSSNPGTDRDVFALAMAEALCAGAGPCCSEKELAAPTDDCQIAVRNEVFVAILTAEEEKRTIDLEGSSACIETYRSALEGADDCFALPHPEFLVDLCPELFSDIPEGALAPGEPCVGTYECSSPELGERACYQANFNESKLCTWFVPIAGGDPCEDAPGFVAVCAEGLGCAPVEISAEVVELRCEPPRQLGEACYGAGSCELGDTCSLNLDGTRECVHVIAPGDPCEERPDACEALYFCEIGMNTCETLPIFENCVNGECGGELKTYCR